MNIITMKDLLDLCKDKGIILGLVQVKKIERFINKEIKKADKKKLLWQRGLMGFMLSK